MPAQREAIAYEVQECIKSCLEAYAFCEQTATYCLEKGGDYVGKDHMKTLMDCAAICQVTGDLMVRESDFHMEFCVLCAEICREAALSCQELNEDDRQLKACADACLQCAESCEEMSRHLQEAP